ncbi:alpha/beta fold hydrolase [Undibacterium sp. Di24W]|uniref:alpha/beta fold hydrolase n=1 Tax=Undibacterium sp. Di24W TaxID=3413033 RepID=UPI003BF42784
MKLGHRVALLFALVGAALYGYYQIKNPEKLAISDSARQGAGGAFVKLSDGVTHYEEAGPKEGRVAVLVHGFSVPSYIWDPTFAALRDAGYHVIRLDLYGRGLSDRPDAQYDGAMYSRQINELLDHLQIKQPIDLFGLSFGGYVVAHFAANYPQKIRSLVLVDPSTKRSAQNLILETPLLGAYLFQVVELPGKAEGQNSDFLHPEQFPGWADRYRPQMQYYGFGRALRRSALRLSNADFPAMYAAIDQAKIPVLLVWGKQDPTLPVANADNVKSAIANLEYVEVDQSGHLPHMEQTAIFNSKMFAFLDKHSITATAAGKAQP